MFEEWDPEPHALAAAGGGDVLGGVGRPAPAALPAAGAGGRGVQLAGERLGARRDHRLLDLELVLSPAVHRARGSACKLEIVNDNT